MRTIMVPDYGDSGSMFQSLQIPEPGEPGYLSPAERMAGMDPERPDPWTPAIAREQAIAEYLDAHPVQGHACQGCEPEPEAG